MPAPPAVSISLGPSRIARYAIVAIALGTLAVLIATPLSAGVLFTATCLLIAWTVDRWRVIGKRRGPRAVVEVRLEGDDRVAVTFASGRRVHGSLRPASRVGPRLTSFVWRPDAARFSRSILILPDMLAVDDFRRFRVLMRYGRSEG